MIKETILETFIYKQMNTWSITPLIITSWKNYIIWITDIAIPEESKIEKEEQEKITKYHDLQIELE